MSDAIWLGTPDMTEIVLVNRAFEEIWGRSADDVYASAQVLVDGIHPDDRDRVLAVVDARSQDEWIVECRVVRPDGSVRWVEAQGFAAVGRAGYKQRAGICRDITDRVTAENHLKGREAFFSKVNQLAGIVGWEINLDTGLVVWNDGLADMLGVPLEKTRLPDVIWDDYIHSEDRPMVVSAGERAMEIGEPTDITFRMLTETGNLIHVRSTGIPEEIDGKLVRRWGYVQDITAGKRAEEAERAAQAERDRLIGYLEVAQKMGKIGTFNLDVLSGEVVWTDEVRRMLGVSRETELSYDVFLACVHPDDRELVDASFHAALSNERPFAIEHRVVVGDEIVWIRQEATVEFDPDGNPVRATGFCQDITEQVDSQAALARSEALLAETGRQALIGGWELDAETLVGSWTDTLFDILEMPRGEVPSLEQAIALCHPDDQHLLSTAVQNGIEHGAPYDLELRYTTAKGRAIHVRALGHPVAVDGRIVKLRGSLQDITKQVEGQAALAKSERLLAETGRHALIGGWELDAETMDFSWTDSLFDIFDLQVGDEPPFDETMSICNAEDRPALLAAIQAGMERGEPFDLEQRATTAAGRQIHTRSIGQPQMVNGKTVKLWGSTQDITRYVQAEEAQRATHDKAEKLLGYLELAQRMGEIGTWALDLVTDERVWTDEVYRLLGVSKATELSHEVFLECVLPDDRELVEGAFMAALAGGPDYAAEYRMLVGRKVVWIRSEATIEVDSSGNPIRMIGYSQDITERKDAEGAMHAVLAEKDSLLGYLSEAQRMGKIGTWDHDLATDKIIWTDEEYRLFGVSKDTELNYEVFRGCVHPDDREFVDAAFQAALDNKAPYDIEHRILANGKVIWIKVEATVEFDSDGNAIRAIGFSQDITEQVDSQTALAGRERLLAGMGRSARIGGWEVDAETMEMLWTDVLFEIYELPRGEQPSWAEAIDFYHPQDRPKHRAAVQNSLKTGEPWDLELRVITAKGNQVHVQTIGHPHMKDGKLVKWWGSIQDVTRYVRAEEAMRAALTETESTLSHLGDAQRLGKIGNWTRDLRSDERTWSDEHYRIWGVPKETELSFEILLECVHPADRHLLEAAFIRSPSTAAPYDLEFRLLVEGAVVWVRSVATIEFDPEGNAVRASGYTQDITEQVESRTSLEKTAALLAETGRTARIGGWELDAETLEVSWTDLLFDIFEVPRGEQPPLDGAIDLYHPQDRPIISQAVQAGLEKGEPFDLRLRVITAKGRLILVRAIGRPNVVDGRTVKLWGSLQDVTEQSQLRSALSTSENRFSTILDTAPDSIILLDQFGTVTEWNQSSTMMFGYTADEAVGQSLAELIIPERYRAAHHAGLEGFKQTGRGPTLGRVVELEAMRADGSELPVEVAIRGIEAEQQRFAIGIIRDIGDRIKQANNLQEAFVETIGAMTNTIATRDPYTADHQRKVSQLSAAIATELRLPEEVVRGVEFGAMIHDIGKISVPAEILNRPGALTDIEFQMIKAHASVGATIIEKIDFPWPIAKIVEQHHERIDGTGYPNGLKGTEISQEARIVGVADVVEAMSSHRPYRPSLGIEAALAEITENRGSLYDAAAVDACVRLFAEDRFEFDSE